MPYQRHIFVGSRRKLSSHQANTDSRIVLAIWRRSEDRMSARCKPAIARGGISSILCLGESVALDVWLHALHARMPVIILPAHMPYIMSFKKRSQMTSTAARRNFTPRSRRLSSSPSLNQQPAAHQLKWPCIACRLRTYRAIEVPSGKALEYRQALVGNKL